MSMTPFERRAVWITTAGTLITGVAYWWMKELLTPAEPWAVVNHPLQPWVLKAHILIAPFQVFSVGMITSRHIWRHYRQGVPKGRRTGTLAAVTFAAVVLTGYALQVVTAELLIRGLAWAHLVLGVVYSVGVAAHWPATRRRARHDATGAGSGTGGAADGTSRPVPGFASSTPGSRGSAASRRRQAAAVPGPDD
ncbi:MAG: hypothetical protein ACOCUW_05620 [Gemmatimonadota bacterium]